MVLFLFIFLAGVASLLLAQYMDIECTQPRKPLKTNQAAHRKTPLFGILSTH